VPARPGALAAPLVLLLACGGGDGGSPGPDAATLAASPLGYALLAGLDLLRLRPDHLGNPSLPASPLPEGISLGASAAPLVFTYACAAAGGGTLQGTVTVTSAPGGAGLTRYEEVFALAGADPATGRAWICQGNLQVTVDGASGTATLHADPAVPVRFVQGASSLAFRPNLTWQWAGPGQPQATGSYRFEGAGGLVLSAVVEAGAELVWGPGCAFPQAGALALRSTADPSGASIPVDFGPGCGPADFDGTPLPL
jgi:hypothetical protein